MNSCRAPRNYYLLLLLLQNAMKMCGIATAPQLMKVMGFAHIASVMSIFFQPIVGAMWMLIAMIGAE